MNNKLISARDRILMFAKEEGVSIRELSKKAGFSHSLLHNAKQIGADKLENILTAYPTLNPEWLLTGTGDMVKESDPRPGEEKSYPLKKEFLTGSPDVKTIPLIGEDVLKEYRGGKLILPFQTEHSLYSVPDFEGSSFLFRVRGDGMFPALYPGDLIACRNPVPVSYAEWNKACLLFTRHQGLLIRKLTPDEKKGVYLASSENPVYGPLAIPEEEFYGISLITGLIRMG